MQFRITRGFLSALFLVGVVLTPPVALAGPQMMHYQGYLRDDAGVPVADPVDLEFTIYDAETEGTVLWTEAHPGVTPTEGVFSVVLGSATALTASLFDGAERWVETSVDGGALAPRRQFLSAPYALRAAVAEVALAGGEADADWTINGDDIYHVDGNVGIGTASPTDKLHIEDGALTVADPTLSATLRPNNLEFDRNGFASYVSQVGNGRLIFTTNGEATSSNARMTIAANGNIGVGTTEPQAKLHIVGGEATGAQDPSANFDHLVVDDDDFAYINLRTPSSATAGILFSDNNRAAGLIQYNHPEDSMRFFTAPGGGRRMTIDGSGNVGIGTTTPASRLSVEGDATITGDAVVSKNFPNLSSVLRLSGPNANASMSFQELSGRLVFATGSIGSEQVRLLVDDSGAEVSGTMTADIVRITGGADLAEPFRVDAEREVEPGMVLSIDPNRPGELRIADRAYDRCVAGIASGANGVRAGITLQQEGTLAEGTVPVALSGRVYCHVDATYGAIEPGDLLTTSDTPGHAMRVSDHGAAQGAVIGKAMTELRDGRGLVLVLVRS